VAAPAPYAGVAVLAVMEGVKVHMPAVSDPDHFVPCRSFKVAQSKTHVVCSVVRCACLSLDLIADIRA